MYTVLIVVFVLAYLLGSVPFGLVICRAFGLGDIRQIGSKNIGATNVLRTGNKLAAFLTLVLDAGKGAIAVAVAWALVGPRAAEVAGFGAFLGHCYPIYLNFKGGKGVATYLGTVLALAWPVGLAVCGTWIATALVTRISSLSALVAALAAPVWAWVAGREEFAVLLVLMAILIFLRHRPNIERLVKGEEPRIGKKP
ncbi:glycerol-3-phosphate 1-O-acyltransferase PlsY [Tranquillimonas alkanivorans]|uniref:Glycerol-3-phosphate acyltransferase n=1 Tax=Tranquillimonas alkanivorans TaxID=441119 RepID=A0A1I5KXM6_9RHOB|nr:glycerol-3-phosphate 1-O-acyltransferase PlsY [Tranquillimonas alkanivorans]SFO89849.1 acyl-phosphate glycerol-3-phosphate acyltransferase [Tranquillimonas alkanivorans]